MIGRLALVALVAGMPAGAWPEGAVIGGPREGGVAARGPNLLRNPSFEVTPGGDNTNPPGWSRWTEIGAAGQFVWDNQAGRGTIGHSTQYALRVENTGDRGGWSAAEPVAVHEQKLYLLCGFVAVHRTAGEVRYGVRFSGAEGLLGEAWTPAITGSTGTNVSDWIAVAAKFRPPEGATLAQVICRADFETGPAWFDDIALYELPEPAPATSGGDAASFREKAGAVAATVDRLRTEGKFWEAAAVSLAQANVLAGVARQDAAAGWSRRAREHQAEAAALVARAAAAARRGEARPDPLTAAVAGQSVPAGVVLAWRGDTAPPQLAAEIRLLAQFGFTDIETDLPWGLWEPARGRYDFSVPDALLAGAARAGARLWPMSGPRYAQIGGRLKGSTTSLRGYTSWYLDQFPDSGLLSSSGERVAGVDGLFREFAFLDPRRLTATPVWLAVWEASLKALVAHCAGTPGLGGWLLSDAPRLGSGPDAARNLLKPGLLGHNPEYVQAFRHWLKERYVTPGALKGAWGSDGLASGGFDRAEPPGSDEINTAVAARARTAATPAKNERYRGTQAWIADWLEFRATALAEGLGWQQRMTGGGVPVLGELAVNGPLDPDGLAAELVGSATAGPLAINLTPGAVPLPLLTHAQDVALAAAGAAGRPVWLAAYSFHVSGVLGGEERQNLFAAPYVDPYVWGGVLSGVRGIFFDGWTGRTGPGTLAYPGRMSATTVTLSDEGIAVARTAAALRVAGPWLAGATIAPPRYALLVNRRAMPFDDPEAGHALAMLNALALGGLHEIPIVTERVLEAGPPPCEVLIAPGVTRLPPGAVAALKAFVAQGGVLIADTYLGTRNQEGEPRGPLADGLDDLFGVTPVTSGGHASEEGTIGLMTAAALTELKVPLPVSLSWFPGGHQLRAGSETEVLAVWTGGAAGHELPAITVHAVGRGRAVLIPRVRLWDAHVGAIRDAKIARPELRALRLGRTNADFNGEAWAIVLRSLLHHLECLPAAHLVRAPVAAAMLDEQAAWQVAAGLSNSERSVSRYLAANTQGGALPFVARADQISLFRQFQFDLDSLAPVRVNLLRGSQGRMAVAINVSSWGREAELALPEDVTAAADVLTGEEWPVSGGRLIVPLAAYQARLLALWGARVP